MHKRGWLAAAASVRLTPSAGLPMGGYAARTGTAVGALDDLEANLLWLADARGGAVVWVGLDVLAVVPQLRRMIAEEIGQALGIDPDRTVVAASHSHSAPAGWHGAVHPVLPGELDQEACRQLAAAVGTAAGHLQPVPVVLSWNVTDVVGVGSNRHDPDGPHDRSAGVLAVRRKESRDLVAVLFDHACHPTVLGPDNRRWSADWVGAARARIRTATAGDARPLPVVFLQGSAGDASPRFHRRGRDHAEATRLGSIVGEAVLRAVTGGDEIAPSWVQVRRTTVRLPVARPVLAAPAPSPTASVRVGNATRTEADVRLQQSRVEAQQSRAAMLRADLPTTLGLPVTLVTVGERRWLHLPVELFADLGARIVDGHPSLRVVGYTDAYYGYVADRPSHVRGDYEAVASFFDLEASEHFVALCRRYVDGV